LAAADASHRQADCLDQARGGRAKRAQHADRHAGKPPFALQGQLSGDLRAIKAAQRGGDIGQQRCRDEIAADQAGEARDQRQRHQFDHQYRIQLTRRHAAGAQCPPASAAVARTRAQSPN